MISYQQLWKADYKNVKRLAIWLRSRGDITYPLPVGEDLESKLQVIAAIMRVYV